MTLLLTSCQQFAEKFKTRGDKTVVLHSWVLGTKFFDKTKNKTYPGKTKVYIMGEDKMRMSIFDPFGFVTVGGLIINGDQMSLNTIDGKDYKGPINDQKVKDLLRVDINPKDLLSLFLQSGFEDKHWNCAVDEKGLALRECISHLHKIKIQWSGLMTQKGTAILLDHDRAKLNFKVKAYKSYEQGDTSIFDL